MAIALPAAGTSGVDTKGTLEQPSAPAPAGPSAFVVRADPRWADEVNAVLAKVAQPTEVDPSSPTKGVEYLARRCGGRAPVQVDAPLASASGPSKLRYAPCVGFSRDARVAALPGDTLENIALRNGLSPAAARTMKVIPKGGSSTPRSITPEALQAGDIVLIKEMPRWTDILARPEVDRSALVSALAEALRCGRTPAEDCLLARNVYVLDSGPRPKQPPPTPEVSRPRSARDDDVVVALAVPGARERGVLPPRELPPAAAAPEAGPDVVVATAAAGPADAATPVPTGPAPVAPEQWPYDAELVAAILNDKAPSIRPVIIGIADGGLADALGAPLPASVFTAPLEPDPTDESDDDDSRYIDDALGAGVFGPDDELRSGDISLCKGNTPPFSTWLAAALGKANHGSVVASVAAALRVRAARPEVGPHLPKLTFFRMLRSACDPTADFRVGDGEMMKALAYLHWRADVINISYTIDSSGEAWFKSAVQGTLGNDEKVLVLPAGNDTPGDLDQNPVCPACLGSRLRTDARTAHRTLVIGAATQALRRPRYSNHGALTVPFYAPGEPAGALDVAGQDASSASPATSYAAPYAALAVAILRSFGVGRALDARDRLAAASWPLYDDFGQPEKDAGVIDLVKVAAVRHHAVEVVEPGADGTFVRRTYVGELVFNTPARLVEACPGLAFSEATVHAIRLGEPNADGERRVNIHKRNDWEDDQREKRTILRRTCRPEGVITLRTLNGIEKAFPMADVRQIQFRWLRD